MRARRYVVAVLVAALGWAATGCAGAARGQPVPWRSAAQPAPERASPPPAPPGSAPAQIGYPPSGDRHWSIAPAGGPPAGTGGSLLRYRVAVEGGITGLDVAGFAARVAAILADPRGWTGAGQWRLQPVSAGHYDFTIYLATPATRDVLCGDGYDRYTSCRNGNAVVLNVARWVHGVPDYGADLETYRTYLVNHEVGHRLGQGHETCPAAGRPAPVMQQQTLGLHGCLANPWPLLGGHRYHGPSGQYDDPVPAQR